MCVCLYTQECLEAEKVWLAYLFSFSRLMPGKEEVGRSVLKGILSPSV